MHLCIPCQQQCAEAGTGTVTDQGAAAEGRGLPLAAAESKNSQKRNLLFLLVSKTTNLFIVQVFLPSTWQTSLIQENRMVIKISRRSASGWAILSLLEETIVFPFLSSSSSWHTKWQSGSFYTHNIIKTASTGKVKLNFSFSDMLKVCLVFRKAV